MNIKDLLAGRLKGVTIDGKELTPEVLIESIKTDKELNIEVSDKIKLVEGEGKFLSDTEINELKEKMDTQGYAKGKTAGEEMFAKELKKDFGIEAEGKSKETVAKLIKEKILSDAKIPEAEKVQELQGSVERLQKSLQEKDTLLESTNNDWENKYNSLKQDTTMQSMVAVEGFKPNHVIAAYKADGFGYTIDEKGNRVLTQNGQVQKDNLEKPVLFDDHFKSWQSTFHVNGGGRGSGNDGGSNGQGSKFKTTNDVYKYMEQNGIDPTSDDGEKLVADFQSQQ